MKLFKKIFSNILLYLLWGILATFFWIWIFNLMSNTTIQKKVVLFADVPKIEIEVLEVELGTATSDKIKMVKVHPFSYSVFDDTEIKSSDLYIVKGADFESYYESFAPLNEEYTLAINAEKFEKDGVVYGFKVYDKETKEGYLTEYITYETDYDYYLFFNIESIHTEGLYEKSIDNEALKVAKKIFE